MAMVNVIIGHEVRKVSKDAYERMFKPKGYRLADGFAEEVKPKDDTIIDAEADEMEEQEHEEMQEEIPISQMNKAQLMKFAKEHDIDTHGAKNVAEAREMIQKAMRERNM
nr:MAG TPA: HeH/LEM domain [Caudoviricetes sp.]